MSALAVAVALAIAAAPARASDAAGPALSSAEQRLVGSWWIGHDGEGSRNCGLRLRPASVIGGHRLTASKACAKVLDRPGDLYAWRVGPDGRLSFNDPTRQPVYMFHALDPSTWATDGADESRYLLVSKAK